jgi:hypothetical protein
VQRIRAKPPLELRWRDMMKGDCPFGLDALGILREVHPHPGHSIKQELPVGGRRQTSSLCKLSGFVEALCGSLHDTIEDDSVIFGKSNPQLCFQTLREKLDQRSRTREPEGAGGVAGRGRTF